MWSKSERWSEELEQWARASLLEGDFGADSQQSPPEVLPEQDRTDNAPQGGDEQRPPWDCPFVDACENWYCSCLAAWQG